MATSRNRFYAAVVILWPIVPAAALLAAMIRDDVLARVLGDAPAHLATCLIAAALVAVGAVILVAVVKQPQSPGRWLAAGVVWLAISEAFHLSYGRFVMELQWGDLLSDYNVLRGRLWPVIVLVALVAPIALAAASRKVARADAGPQPNPPTDTRSQT